MPLYDFRCSVCGYEFEALVPMFKYIGIDCRKCGKPAFNIGVYRTYMKTDVKGPGAAWIRNERESPVSILKEDYDPPVESRKDMEDMIKRKGVVPLG